MEAVQQLKVRKMLENFTCVGKSDLLSVHVDAFRVRKIPPPQKPSATICKIAQNFMTPLPHLCGCHK